MAERERSLAELTALTGRVVEQLKRGCIKKFHGPGCSMNWPGVDRAKTDRLMRKAAYIIARSLLGGVAENERLRTALKHAETYMNNQESVLSPEAHSVRQHIRDALAETDPAIPSRQGDGGAGGGPGTNTGHGHVWTRPDGKRARCGGPAMCSKCAQDFARFGRHP